MKHGRLYIWRVGNHGKAASHQSLRFREGKGEEMELGKVERARVEPRNPQARAGKWKARDRNKVIVYENI